MIATALAFLRNAFRLKRMLITGAIFSGIFLVVLSAMYVFLDVPEPDDLATAQSIRVIDVEGRTVGRINAGTDRISVPLKQVPAHVREAVISIEDRHFYRHSGVRPTSIVRAALSNIVARGVSQGGSTITQQYVKNAFVGRERSIWRKMKEAVLAVKFERQKSKDEILEAYLNTIYFGRGAYGIEAAARTYFGAGAKNLTLSQAAMLAGAIAAPELTDPVRHPERSERRRAAVLRAMVRDRHITEGEAARALRSKPRVRARAASRIAPHFLEDVRLELEKRFGAAALYRGGITVKTTLDLEMQQAAERAVRTLGAPASYVPDLALVAIDPATGGIRAMIGARDYRTRQLNLARSRRQPGSAFKPAVLTAALRDGTALTQRFDGAGKRTFRLPGGKTWTVSNFDGRGAGTVDLVQATQNSVNTVYAELIVEETDPESVVEVAGALGVRSKLDAFYSLALGTEEITPIDLASMYATFAAQGVHRQPYLIERVAGPTGEMFTAEHPRERAITEEIAARVGVALQAVIRSGTGRRADPGRPAAGKTGTTQDNNDTWFAGYTPDLAAVVWNGHPSGEKQLPDDAFGGKYPAQLWGEFMREALRGRPARPLPVPESMGTPTGSPTPSSSPSPTRSALPTALPSSKPPVPLPSSTPTPTPTPSEPPPSPTPTPTPSDKGQGTSGGP